jgi:hypothetical protein
MNQRKAKLIGKLAAHMQKATGKEVSYKSLKRNLKKKLRHFDIEGIKQLIAFDPRKS